MNLEPQQIYCGFRLLRVDDAPSAHAKAYVFSHEASKARLLFLENEDNDKAFSITFKTPPQDSTGVFHILEHSVLNGSNKFPVKEPFVNLLKTSMYTFLNAMTFCDKTMYPVASTNNQDLLNLTDVYLDAVFHPAILHNEKIFQQEGWHYELDENGSLSFNGVVYNEMKGALSEPEDVLQEFTQACLLPNTCYRYISGGDPNDIPNLSYEQFKAEYLAHYQPANSYIILYGAIDTQAMFSLIDEHLNNATEAAKAQDGHACAYTPRSISLQEPIISLGNVKEMVTAPENACCAIAYVTAPVSNLRENTAAGILFEALAGSNEAPLKRYILDQHLASEFRLSWLDHYAQPFAYAEFKGTSHETAQNIKNIMDDACQAVLKQGIDPALIEAALSHIEFIYREYNLGYPDGVLRSMDCMSCWLYDEHLPFQAMEIEPHFAFLREHLHDGYFEALFEKIFLQNTHIASAEILPIEEPETSAEQQELLQREQRLHAADKKAILQAVSELRAAQEAPDLPENIAKLPQLSISDLEDAPLRPAYGLQTNTPSPCIYHEVDTNGLSYVARFFDLSCIACEDLPYVSILCTVLGKLPTEYHSAAELDVLIQSKLGNFTVLSRVFDNEKTLNTYRAYLTVDTSSLAMNSAYTALISSEVLLHTTFTDIARIKDLLTQQRIRIEQNMLGAGHSYAMARAASYYSPAARLNQYLSGVDYYRFLKDLLAHFDERAHELSAKLESISRTLFVHENELVSLAGSNESCSAFWQACSNTAALPCLGHTPDALLRTPQPKNMREAFITPSDVSFSAQAFNTALLQNQAARAGFSFSGSSQVLANCASFDYLWNEVRVKGGAYGTGMRAHATGGYSFYSYRDPHIDETFERFRNTTHWLHSFAPSKRELEGYIVNTVSAFDKPLKPRTLITEQDAHFLSDREEGFRLRSRQEVIETTLDALHAIEPALEAVFEQNCVCTFGSKALIENAQTQFNVIDLLSE